MAINEILYYQAGDSLEFDRDHEWVELFNADIIPHSLNGWTVTNGDLSAVLILPDVLIPPGGYFLIRFTSETYGCVNDLDLSDGCGVLCTGDDPETTDAFLSEGDEVALFSDLPSAESIEDFLAWKASDDPFEGRAAHDFAVEANMWTDGEFFNAANAADHPFKKTKRVYAGESIGRDKYSKDTNTPEDWDITGGPDAIDITPCARNYSLLKMTIGGESPPQPPKQWTFMVYLDGDNDLEEAAWRDLNEMEFAGGSDANVNVVVMFDLIPGFMDIQVSLDGGINFNPTATAWRGSMGFENDPERVLLHPAAGDNPNLGERNMGDPNELSGFVQWAAAKFPAQNYALILWDHGAGWEENTNDDTDNDAIYIGELKAALGGMPVQLELIGFDECLMGMIEVAHQVSAKANYFVASQETIANNGWPYDTILSGLKANPGWDGAQLGNRIVNDFHQFYTVKKPDPIHTLSSVDLGAPLANAVHSVNTLAKQLAAGLEDYRMHFNPDENVQMVIKKNSK